MQIDNFIERWRKIKDKQFPNALRFFPKIGITANVMTTISLLAGITAVYFAFENYLLFIIFGLMHYIADLLDGGIARLMKPTTFGKYYDNICDRIVTFLLLVKIGSLFVDFYAYIIAVLFVIAHVIHMASKFKSPILFTRSFMLLFTAFYVPNVFASSSHMPVFMYLFTGVAVLYSLARQLQWFMQTKSTT